MGNPGSSRSNGLGMLENSRAALWAQTGDASGGVVGSASVHILFFSYALIFMSYLLFSIIVFNLYSFVFMLIFVYIKVLVLFWRLVANWW